MAISSDRGSVNTAPIAGIGSEAITPAVGDFMQAFRSGFLTVADLAKRGAAVPAEIAGAQQDFQDQIQIRPLSRQASVGQISSDIQLQPRRAALQSGQIDAALTALPTASETQASGAEREKSAQLRNSLASSVPGVRENALANASSQQVIDLWTTAHGQPPPETIEVPGGGVTPKPIEEFVLETYGPNSLAVNAQAVLTRPDVKQAYAAYAQEAANRPLTIFKDDPKYLEALKKDLQTAEIQKLGIAAQAKAAPDILVAQAKAGMGGGEDTARTAKMEDDLTGQATSRLKDFRDQTEAYRKISQLGNKAQPTNADDIALLYSYIKLIDPGSVVRGEEVKLTQKATPLMDVLIQKYKLLYSNKEGVLAPGIRKDYLNTVDSLYRGAQEGNLPELKRLETASKARKLNLDVILNSEERALLSSGVGAETNTGTTPANNTDPSRARPGDVLVMPDGRRIRVKAVTATGIIPED